MSPVENVAAGRHFLLMETSPETLSIVQQLDFSSFAESEASQDACNNVVDVHSASEDPFDSDDLEELLNINPPTNSPSKTHASQSKPTKQAVETLTESLAFSPPKQPLLPLFLQVQKPRQEMKIKVGSLPIRREQVSEDLLKDLMSEPWSDPSSPEPYFSCKLEPKDDLLSSPKKPLLDSSVAQKLVKPENHAKAPVADVLFEAVHSSVRFSSPRSIPSPALKRARVSSPEKFQSYESQMQFRLFSTTSASFMSKTVRLAHDANPTIQLATQKPSLHLLENTGRFSEEEMLREPEKVVTAIRPSREQNHVLQLAKAGKSIFFTGSAGTGKSFLLKSIIKAIKQMKKPGTVAVTASTGLAACNVGGITLHSFAGIGLGKGDLKSLIKNVKKNRKAFVRWKETEVLIIDEISMIDGRLFHHLDQIARNVRRAPDKPFGGIQIIICGDFYQLPPVSRNEVLTDGTLKKDEAVFAFESKAWDEILDHSIVLKEVFRQKGDQEFIDMLNDMRHGIVSPEAELEFRRLMRPLECPEGIVPTELYATRVEVDRANNLKLNRITGRTKQYVAIDGGALPPAVKAQMLNNFLAPRELILKENAQVMCIKNIDDTLVNGSLGTIIKFVDRDTYLCERIEKEKPNLGFKEFTEELRRSRSQEGASDSVFNFLAKKFLAEENSAETTHKTEEKGNPENVKVDQCSQSSADPFEAGSSFVPFINENTERKLNFIQELQKTSKKEEYPLVRFICPDGITTRDHLMEPERWEIVDDKTDEVLVSRVQFPLMLAWALSIHKSQGQTLQKVRVDLSRIFENGQAYVALSRAVSRAGLQVLNFRKERVRAHPIVETFYNSLTSSGEISKRISRSWLP